MRFKDWLAEELSSDGLGQTSNPTADKQVLNKAISTTTQMPDAAKLAPMATGNNRVAVQKTAMDVAQKSMKMNPLWNQTPSVTAPAIANGLIGSFTANQVPKIGSAFTGTTPSAKMMKKK